ncbi:double-stranded DNA binding protein [Aeromonas phage Ahp1_CNU-2021]|nr:double-stranded DNA binding protein [Aeromonas phage Ahp1_CNU-2021]
MAKQPKAKVEFNVAADAKALKDMIKEASDIKTMIEGQNDALKATKDRAKTELGLEPKKFNQLLSMYHKRTRDEVEANNEEIVELYDKTFN